MVFTDKYFSLILIWIFASRGNSTHHSWGSRVSTAALVWKRSQKAPTESQSLGVVFLNNHPNARGAGEGCENQAIPWKDVDVDRFPIDVHRPVRHPVETELVQCGRWRTFRCSRRWTVLGAVTLTIMLGLGVLLARPHPFFQWICYQVIPEQRT